MILRPVFLWGPSVQNQHPGLAGGVVSAVGETASRMHRFVVIVTR